MNVAYIRDRWSDPARRNKGKRWCVVFVENGRSLSAGAFERRSDAAARLIEVQTAQADGVKLRPAAVPFARPDVTMFTPEHVPPDFRRALPAFWFDSPDRSIIERCQLCRHPVILHDLADRPWPYCEKNGEPCQGLTNAILSTRIEDWLVRRAAAKRSAIPLTVRNEVLARDGMVCRYCSRSVHRRRRGPGRLHFDHVYPWILGGSHSPENVVVSCARCNITKQDDPAIVPADWTAPAQPPLRGTADESRPRTRGPARERPMRAPRPFPV